MLLLLSKPRNDNDDINIMEKCISYFYYEYNGTMERVIVSEIAYEYMYTYYYYTYFPFCSR